MPHRLAAECVGTFALVFAGTGAVVIDAETGGGVGKYSAGITDRYWDTLDGALPDPSVFGDLPGGADGRDEAR